MTQKDPRFVSAPSSLAEFSELLQAGRYAITQGEKQALQELADIVSGITVNVQDASAAQAAADKANAAANSAQTSAQKAELHANDAKASADIAVNAAKPKEG